MEWVSYIQGGLHTDRPESVEGNLAAYIRRLNDQSTDSARQLLKPILPRLIGTRAALNWGVGKRALPSIEGNGLNSVGVRKMREIVAILDAILPDEVTLEPDQAERALEFCGITKEL
jgi:hypothetical protein